MWKKTSLFWWPQKRFPCCVVCTFKNSTEVLCPENERIYIPGGIRQPVSGRTDKSPSESSSFHHWTWICWLSLSHVHKLATHMITNTAWNKIGSPGTDGFTCWKDVLRACQIQVSAKFYLSSSSPSLRVTSWGCPLGEAKGSLGALRGVSHSIPNHHDAW